MIELKSASAEETLALGRRLAGLLRPGDVVSLSGRLGCGKTVLVAGIGDGLGVDEPVVSPSFVLVRRYSGFLPLVHADVYRIASLGEFEDLDVTDEARDGVLVIEWGAAVERALPEDLLSVEFEVTGDTERTVRITPRGSWKERSLGGLAA